MNSQNQFQQGQRVIHADGQVGYIVRVLRGVPSCVFTSDNGATFTALADHLRPEGCAPVSVPPLRPGECRTLAKVDRQRTPVQLQQAQARPLVDDHGVIREMADAEVRRFAEDDDADGCTSDCTRLRDAWDRAALHDHAITRRQRGLF